MSTSNIRQFKSVVCAALLSLLLVAPASVAQWSPPVIDTVSVIAPVIGKQTYPQSLAVDANGYLHAVWGEERGGPVAGVWVMYRTNSPVGQWRPPETVNFNGEVAFAPALTLLASGVPVVAYEANDSLVMALQTFETWLHQPIAGPAEFACCPTVAVDSVGIPHLAWIAEDPNVDLYRIAYFYNMWGQSPQILEGSELGLFGLGAAPQLTVTPEGIAHIFYRGGDYMNYHIHHAWNNAPGGVQWNYEILFSDNAEDFLAAPHISPGGTLHLAMSGNDGWGFPGRTFYRRKDVGGTWSEPENVAAAYSTTWPVLDVDWAGFPHVITMQVSGNILTGNLIVSERSPGFWFSNILAGDDLFEPSLAIGWRDYGHVLCRTGGNTGNYSVLHLRSAGRINSPPPMFLRVLPADSALDPWDPTPPDVRFVWTRLPSPGTTSYILRVFAPDYGEWEETHTTMDTTFVVTIPLPVLDEVFAFYWTVRAVVGTDTFNAANGTGIFFINIQDADEPPALLPAALALTASPNPFNPATNLEFTLPRAETVELAVFDMTGRRVRTLLQGRQPAGAYRVAFNGADLPSGVYLARLETERLHRTAKLMLIK